LKPVEVFNGFFLLIHTMRYILVLLCVCTALLSEAQSALQKGAFDAMFELSEQGVWEVRDRWLDPQPEDSLQFKDNARLVAIGLNVTLGMLGVHRIYLGTDVKVPIVYALTFGGGGVLWLVDLGFLIATKDIRPFMHNKHVFMFSRK